MPSTMPRETAEALLREAKQMGFSDRQLAHLWGSTETQVAKLRRAWGIIPVYKTVDTCAAEFEAHTPYHYSTYEQETEVRPCDREKIIILGGGPNRIGQGIEFDYCCCHAVFALRELGYETIMVNSNPETVSTDYDTSDRLYFEPLTFEDVLHLVEVEKPKGVIIQFGGQTPLKLAVPLERAGVPVLGTSPDSIDLAEDRKRFGALIDELGIRQPENGTATSFEEARVIAARIQYPVLVRPSYVLGGRAMEIVYDETALERYFREAVQASPDHPVLVDRYLEDAIEVDVDAVGDGARVYIGGIMEHIEYAGVHSGDSACVIPPRTLSPATIDLIKKQTRQLALRLNVRGLINIQFAVSMHHGIPRVYVLEVNPRGSRTVPFVSKATGVPLAKVAARAAVGVSLDEQGLPDCYTVNHQSVKEAVLPFVKFPNVDPLLGPEMRSTGEVMGIDHDFGLAYVRKSADGPRDSSPATGPHEKQSHHQPPGFRQGMGGGHRRFADPPSASRYWRRSVRTSFSNAAASPARASIRFMRAIPISSTPSRAAMWVWSSTLPWAKPRNTTSAPCAAARWRRESPTSQPSPPPTPPSKESSPSGTIRYRSRRFRIIMWKRQCRRRGCFCLV